MARNARILIENQPSVYHVMSHTALDGFPFSDVEKDYLLSCIHRFCSVYFTEVLGFCLMGNHFHLLVRMIPGEQVADQEVINRYHFAYGPDVPCLPATIERCRRKWSSLSELMREIKQTFSRYYNKRHSRRGYFWGERFKSVLVQDGPALLQCLAYIDLNPVRAGIVSRPEDYRWSSIGYHLQSDNRNDMLSLDFGMTDYGSLNPQERLRQYRQFLYENGVLEKNNAASMPSDIIEQARRGDYTYTLSDRLRLRTRWFTESGIIGSKAFVAEVLNRLPNTSGRERKPREIQGLDFFALKRLVE